MAIEVKAGKSGSLKSLHQFIYQKKIKTAIRFDLNKYSKQTVSYKVNSAGKEKEICFDLKSYPLYAVGVIEGDMQMS